MAFFLSSSRILRSCTAGKRSNASSFLKLGAAKEHIQKLGLRSRSEFFEWCRAGERPAFIPANPSNAYRDIGWVSYSDFFGNDRRSRTISDPKGERVDRHIRAEAKKDEVVDALMQLRPDIEVRKLAMCGNTSHWFRIRPDEGAIKNPPVIDAIWVPIQIRCVSRGEGRARLYVKHTANPETGVIIVSEHGVLAGLRRDLPDGFRPSDFHDVQTVIAMLDLWWVSRDRSMSEDCTRGMRVHAQKEKLISSTVPCLKHAYFDRLGLPMQIPLDRGSHANIILGTPGAHRILVRNASCEGKRDAQGYWYVSFVGESVFRSESDRIDFLIVCFPGADVAESDAGFPTIFMFPWNWLVRNGLIRAGSRRRAMYLHPPWKKETRKISAVRKAEQAPFFVDSVERFAEILKEYGGTAAGAPAGRSKKFEATDS